jgi:hypothetical protein
MALAAAHAPCFGARRYTAFFRRRKAISLSSTKSRAPRAGQHEGNALTPREIWALIDDRAGNTGQTLGVAEALGRDFRQIRVDYAPSVGLPNFIRGSGLLGVDAESQARLRATVEWPGLVIAAGRRLAPVVRWIKARGRDTRLCQVMDPGWPGRTDFDLIAIPAHDGKALPGANILRVVGAPHRIVASRLDAAREAWAERLGGLRAPRIAALIGGATKDQPFSEGRAATLGKHLAALAAATGGQIMLTTSRRTGRAPEDALLAQLPPTTWAYRWGDSGENPYFGFLAWADILIVTGDSMSMVSEACGTAKPVLIDAPAAETSPKHARLHADLVARNRALRLDAGTETLVAALPQLDCTPINAAQDIAAALAARGLV